MGLLKPEVVEARKKKAADEAAVNAAKNEAAKAQAEKDLIAKIKAEIGK